MTHNPYAPPIAAVTDPPAPSRGERPPAVRVAMVLMWAGMVLAVLVEFIGIDELLRNPNVALSVSLLVIGLVVNEWLIFNGKGRNWSRIVYPVLLSGA